jgi:hypothetical protein
MRSYTSDFKFRPNARYHTYVRFSGDGQRDGSSVERQIQTRKDRAAKLGLPFVDRYYLDEARSGFYGEHLEGDFKRMTEAIERGDIRRGDVIGVDSQSRLGRLKLLEAVWQFINIVRRGILLDIGETLISADDINGPDGFMVMLQAMNEMVVARKYSADIRRMGRATNDLKRAKLIAGQREGVMVRAGAGCFVGDRCHAWLRPRETPSPDGYMYDVVPEIREELRPILHMLLDMGGPMVAQRANAMGIKPLSNYHNRKKKAVAWTEGMIVSFAKDRAIIGEYHPGALADAKDEDGEEIWGKRVKVPATDSDGNELGPMPYYPPLFPEGDPDYGLFWRVQEAIRQRSTNGRGRKGEQFSNLITGIGRCDVCTGTLTLCNSSGNSRVPTKYLKCTNHKNKVILPEGHPLAGQKCSNVRGFPYRQFEDLLFDLFQLLDMAPLLALLIPVEHKDDLSGRRLAETEGKLSICEMIVRLRPEREMLVAMATDRGEWADMTALRFTPEKIVAAYPCDLVSCPLFGGGIQGLVASERRRKSHCTVSPDNPRDFQPVPMVNGVPVRMTSITSAASRRSMMTPMPGCNCQSS